MIIVHREGSHPRPETDIFPDYLDFAVSERGVLRIGGAEKVKAFYAPGQWVKAERKN